MLVRSNNNSIEEKDSLAIGQKEFKETNPFGYKDYKETYDNSHWWKKVEYTDESGKKVIKEINPFGQILIYKNVVFNENSNKIKKPRLDDGLFDDFDISDNQQKTKNKQHCDLDDTQQQNENSLSENDFYKMDLMKSQYLIYKLLVNISSSLSYIQEVDKQNDE